jgi:NADH dehydrogenase [ubiquinone] 1 alpha subcomplex assembly factor 6
MATFPFVGPVKPTPRAKSARVERFAVARPLSPVAELVRRRDPDRFQTALFAPIAHREALFALYAFNSEIARVREIVSEPMLGRIRLEWWRQAIAAAYEGAAARRHIVAQPLTRVIRERALSRGHFARLIDAREGDLEAEPPPDLGALEAYAAASSASLVHLALEILGASGAEALEAGTHIGIAYALAGLLRAMPFSGRGGRPFIPRDIARKTGLLERDLAARRSTPALAAAAAEIAATASSHLDRAREKRHALPRSALPALLPAVVAERALIRLRRAGYDPLAPSLLNLDPLPSWRLLLASLRHRF